MWLLIGGAALVLSLGPTLTITAGNPTDISLPYHWLYENVPLFNAIRAPVRWAVVLTLALAMLAAGLSDGGAGSELAALPGALGEVLATDDLALRDQGHEDRDRQRGSAEDMSRECTMTALRKDIHATLGRQTEFRVGLPGVVSFRHKRRSPAP